MPCIMSITSVPWSILPITSQFLGFRNPAEHPYEIVYQSLIRANRSFPRPEHGPSCGPGSRISIWGPVMTWKRSCCRRGSLRFPVLWMGILEPPESVYEIALEPDWVGRLLALPEAKERAGGRENSIGERPDQES